MTTTPCPECGKEVASFEPACDSCGSPMSRELYELQKHNARLAGETAGLIDFLQGNSYGSRISDWVKEFPELMAGRVYDRVFRAAYESAWSEAEDRSSGRRSDAD